MSNWNPESMKAGRNVTMMATWPATNWFLATVEMSRPIPSAESRKSEEAPSSTQSEPRSGTSNISVAMTADRPMPPIPSTK